MPVERKPLEIPSTLSPDEEMDTLDPSDPPGSSNPHDSIAPTISPEGETKDGNVSPEEQDDSGPDTQERTRDFEKENRQEAALHLTEQQFEPSTPIDEAKKDWIERTKNWDTLSAD